ncbi:MAG: hypothetical protein K6T75_01255 [Acetobacteraceae bacterium]|nr:hypothetical protein [Acetobacteraceae bacterium]
MSQITSYSAEIVLEHVAEGRPLEDDPGWRLLREAVEATAQEYRGRVGATIVDYFGRVRPCDISLITAAFPRGLGVVVDRATGRVAFLYDDYGGYGDVVRRQINRVTQNFLSLAVAHALRAMNYQVDVEEKAAEVGDEKTVVVRGVL